MRKESRTAMERWLVICSGGRIRSPAAADWLRSRFEERGLERRVGHAPLTALVTRQIDPRDQDVLLLMEKWMAQELCSQYVLRSDQKIYIADIPDIYTGLDLPSRSPYDDTVTSEEAGRILDEGFAQHRYKRHFGHGFFYPLLEARLRPLI